MDLFQSRNAIVSSDGLYRYRLERTLGGKGKVAAFILVNPSTADAEVDDHTIRKLVGFSRRLGFSKLIVGNKFAFRATDIKALRTVQDPVGPENDKNLRQIIADADIHIAAWGCLSKLPVSLRTRWQDVALMARAAGVPLYSLGVAQDGHPKHPLMLSYDNGLSVWPTT